MSWKLIRTLRKRKLDILEKEAREKYKINGMISAREHIELYLKVLARVSNPFERAENIQSTSFVIDETVVAKAYNKNTGFTYVSVQVLLSEELEMDPDSNSHTENST